MKLLQLCLLLIGVACSTARLTVQVQLVSYINSNSEDCDGGNCEDVLGGTCDNIFQFCLRAVGSVTCLSAITTNDIEDDSFAFSQPELNELGISNPIQFTNIQTGVELELFVTITDEDIGSDDLVDQITIPVSQPQNTGSLGPATTYFGSCGRARITVRIGITCVGNFVPLACEQCLTGFQAPDCVNCAPDYYPSGTCSQFCQPRNDTLGHFTCNSLGERVCLPGYTDPDTNCVMCTGNFQEPDCVQCDQNFQGVNCDQCLPKYTSPSTGCLTCVGNFQEPDCSQCDPEFQGTNCDVCAENYYPQGICSTFCEPRDDALGHFTCNSLGEKVCLSGYTDPETDCIMCLGNFLEPNCSQCDLNFQGTNCDTCAPNYFPQGRCNVFCVPRDDSTGHFTCNSATGEKECLEGFTNPSSNCVDVETAPEAEEGSSSDGGFVGSPGFYVIIAIVVGVPVVAFSCILLILCGLCLLSNNVRCDCSFPEINCDDCCRSFCKWASCGIKCDDANPAVVCIVIILGILAAPAIILIAAVVLPILMIGACLLYTLTHCCD